METSSYEVLMQNKIFPFLVVIAVVIMGSILIEASLGGSSDAFRVDTATLTMK